MRYSYASDCHSHSACSFDGDDEMEAMCEKAIELGLYYYTITDHCECNEYESCSHDKNGYRGVVRRAYQKMEECRKKYSGLRLLKGIELGQPLQSLKAAQDALGNAREYDLVIGSLHNVNGYDDFYHLGGRGLSPAKLDALMKKYFEELLEMTEWGGFDTLAHITYPLRYIGAGKDLNLDKLMNGFISVFKTLIKQEKALELNTSRLLPEDGPALPDLQLFRLYYKMGGRLVTIGADAHRVQRLAHGIDEGLELLKEAGFKEFTVFVGRKPTMLPIK